jgi:hypothetical protein
MGEHMRRKLSLIVFSIGFALVMNPTFSLGEPSTEIQLLMKEPVNSFEFFLSHLEIELNKHAGEIRALLPILKDIRVTYLQDKNAFIITIYTVNAGGEPERIPNETLSSFKREISSVLKTSARYPSRISPRPKSVPAFDLWNLRKNITLIIKESWADAGGSKLRYYRSPLMGIRWETKEHDVDFSG